MAKLKPGEKRIQLSFQRPDDLRLFEFMLKRAYECRWEISTFVLASLQDAFKGQIDEEQIDALAQEALSKVRERKTAPPEPPAPKEDFDRDAYEHGKIEPPPSIPFSAAEAYEQAVKQIEALNAMPMSVARKGVPSPPVPPETDSNKTVETDKPRKPSRKKNAALVN